MLHWQLVKPLSLWGQHYSSQAANFLSPMEPILSIAGAPHTIIVPSLYRTAANLSKMDGRSSINHVFPGDIKGLIDKVLWSNAHWAVALCRDF